jgi:hypothetical protein
LTIFFSSKLVNDFGLYEYFPVAQKLMQPSVFKIIIEILNKINLGFSLQNHQIWQPKMDNRTEKHSQKKKTGVDISVCEG